VILVHALEDCDNDDLQMAFLEEFLHGLASTEATPYSLLAKAAPFRTAYRSPPRIFFEAATRVITVSSTHLTLAYKGGGNP